MKNILALTTLPLLVAIAACAGNNGNWGGGDDNNSNPGDDGGATDDGTTPGDDGSTPPPPANAPLATGLSITGITIDQAVEIGLVKNGAPATKNAPVVAGRRAMFRVFVTPSGSFSPHPITGVLTLHTAGQDHTFNISLTPKAASSDGTFSSTFNFNVDPSNIGTDTTYLVQLKDPSGTGSGDTSAQYPTSGTPTSLGAQQSGEVKIYVFPIHFTGASGSTPATGAGDLSAYQSVVMGMYPASNVTLTVQPTFNYAGSIPTANGNGWSQLLTALTNKRAGDPSPDVYYYGAFAPTASFDTFCGYGCVAGLSNVPNSPNDASQKVSIGLVYGGNDAQATGQTMAHEVGHGHGREHSPTNQNIQGCSEPSGIDPSYPYANGAIGVWGYDTTGGGAIDPSKYYDIMGYCAYDWISDYTYKALFDWIAADNGADMIVAKTPTMYRMITVEPDGSLDDATAPFPLYGAVSGQTRTVTFDDGGVTRTVTGYFTPFDHVGGGNILVKDESRFASITSLRVDGKFVKLAH
ncbi:MAG TPA: hypothetical protein VGH28_25705 [Polyangiaceae bacterium]